MVALTLVVGTPVIAGVAGVANARILDRALVEGPHSFLLLSSGQVVLVVTGLVVAVVADAFAQGRRLADDVAGLV